MTEIRIIVSFGEGFRAYQGALTAAIKILRPDTQVITAEPEKIGEAVRRHAPDIVIGNRFDGVDLECVPAWVELSLDPTKWTRIKVNGVYSEIINPTLDELLGIIDEVAKLPGREADRI